MTRAFLFVFVLAVIALWLTLSHGAANNAARKLKRWIKEFGGKQDEE